MTIKLIGTTHLTKEAEILKIIKNEKPDILGVELDDFRADIILKEKEAKPNEDKSLLGKITDKLKSKAKEENLDYGSDMKTVLRFAKSNKLECLFVDMPILKIQELFNLLPKEEQLGFQKELQEFESVKIDTPLDKEEVLTTLKSRYPIAFEFLINMRNLYITNQLLKAHINNPTKKILVFLGKSHVEQIKRMLK